MDSKTVIIGGGILVAGYFLLKKSFSYASLAENMTLKLKNARIHKVDLQGIHIAVVAALNNPTPQSATITKPVVSILRQKSGQQMEAVTTSDASNQKINIAPNGVTTLPEIMVTIGIVPLLQLISSVKWGQIIGMFGKKGANAAVAFQDSLTTPLFCQTSTQVDGMFIKTAPVRIL